MKRGKKKDVRRKSKEEEQEGSRVYERGKSGARRRGK